MVKKTNDNIVRQTSRYSVYDCKKVLCWKSPTVGVTIANFLMSIENVCDIFKQRFYVIVGYEIYAHIIIKFNFNELTTMYSLCKCYKAPHKNYLPICRLLAYNCLYVLFSWWFMRHSQPARWAIYIYILKQSLSSCCHIYKHSKKVFTIQKWFLCSVYFMTLLDPIKFETTIVDRLCLSTILMCVENKHFYVV